VSERERRKVRGRKREEDRENHVKFFNKAAVDGECMTSRCMYLDFHGELTRPEREKEKK
jgi:hypothetical protein